MKSIIDLVKEQRLLVPRVAELCSTLTKLVADTEEFRQQHPELEKGEEEWAEDLHMQLTELVAWAEDLHLQLTEIAASVDSVRRKRQELEDELANNRCDRQEPGNKQPEVMLDIRVQRKDLAVRSKKLRNLQADLADQLDDISLEQSEIAAWAEDHRVQLARLMEQGEGAPQ